MRHLRLVMLILAGCLWLGASLVHAADVADDFRQNCFSCHTIGGGRLTGPDLKDVLTRREKSWILQFIQSPKKIIDSGDPVAVKLRDESRGVVMPDIAGMTPARAEMLLGLILEESKLEKSKFKGVSLIDRPFLPSDVIEGRALFTGKVRLKNGAAPCLSCHATGNLKGVFGGGALGPDLSEAVSRLGGDKSLAAWLVSPVTPVMRPLFQKYPIHETEILPLVAFLKDNAGKAQSSRPQSRLPFLISGIGGGIFLLTIFDFAWSRRLRSVRRRMIERSNPTEDRHE